MKDCLEARDGMDGVGEKRGDCKIRLINLNFGPTKGAKSVRIHPNAMGGAISAVPETVHFLKITP